MKPKKEARREPIVTPEKIELNFSGANMYLHCGMQYKFRYVDKIKDPPKIVLIEGSSHHKALEENNKLKKSKGRDLTANTMTDIFMGDFRSRVKDTHGRLDWEGEKENKIYARAKILHKDYRQKIAPVIRPLGIEKPLEKTFKIGGDKLTYFGTTDLETKDFVYDYKTSRRSKSQEEVDGMLQLSLYSYALSKVKVGVIQLVKAGTPYVGMILSRRTKGQILWALSVFRSAALGIQAKRWHLADPSSWKCSPTYCGYWSICRGKVEGRR